MHVREQIKSEMGKAPERLVDAKVVANYTGMSTKWVYMHASGKRKPLLPSYKMGGAVRFKLSEVEEFLRLLKRGHQPEMPVQ